MPFFLIFGGSEAPPHAWERCRASLAERGHGSCVVDWPTAPWQNGVESALDALVARIGEIPEPVLVGHSMAGLFLPLLGERLKARSEIYLAALVPHSGRTVYDRLFDGEEIFAPDWTALYQEMIASPDHPALGRKVEQFLFHDGADGPYADDWRPFPLALDLFYDVKFPLVECSHRPRRYIVCSEDRTVRPQWQRRAALELPSPHVPQPPIELAAGHSPHVTRPHELATLLDALC